MTLLIVAVAWIYVALMMALAEALSPIGSVLGALVTFIFYGALPLALVLYVLAAPLRRRIRRRSAALAADPDRGGEPAGDPVAAVREEP